MRRSAIFGVAALALLVAGCDALTQTGVRSETATDPVERGRYLVSFAGCNDCHTPGYPESAGGIDEKQWLMGSGAGWQGEWGTTFPINLRLFMQSLTAEQWLKVARTPARPPMPWFALRDMSDADLVAIYHYVRSLGPAGVAAPEYVPPGKATSAPVVKFPG
jgi:mono/diheme cytochrome c family protein